MPNCFCSEKYYDRVRLHGSGSSAMKQFRNGIALTVTFSLLAVFCQAATAQVNMFNRNRRAPVIRDVSAAEVRDAIKRGIEALEERQKDNGEWSNNGAGVNSYSNGVTALCTLALINASDRKDTPAIKKGLEAIIKEPNRSTYFVSLRVMCLANADPKGRNYLPEVQTDINWLKMVQERNGGWGYGRQGGHGTPDSSNSQFALLALHEAAQMGAVIEDEVWRRTKDYWKRCRVEGGGYSYHMGTGKSKRAMSAAGMASTIIIEENLPDLGTLFDAGRIKCCGKPDDAAKHEELTADHLGSKFAFARGMRGRGVDWAYYFMYALERAGRVSGRRFFGAHDWYREGASKLRDWKIEGEGWTGQSVAENKNVATSMALLFLSKGKRPIAIGKYLFETDEDLIHQKGVHYLTRNLEKAWEQKLNWQEVRGFDASADDLLESPVIFMSGNKGFVFNDKQKKALKTYLENGGFLFADCCEGEGCKRAEFNLSFRALMEELFPDSKLERLPVNHPVWNAHYNLDRPDERPLWGLQACCRTSVIYCPRNLACLWNADRPGIEKQMRGNARFKDVLGDVKYATKVGVNVVTYATGRELKEKGDRPKIDAKAKSVLMHRSLELPKLAHSGGQDEAPNAWRNIQKRFAESGISINLKKKFVNADLEQLSNHPFVFMHGRSKFSFSEEERLALRTYLQMGGFIFADSICSSKEFTSSFRSEMRKVLGEDLKPIPASHPIWTDDKRYLFRIENVTLRKKRGEGGKFEEIKGPPDLEGHEIDGRLAVVFSQNDISCAMESTIVSQCEGYKREDAERIGINVLLYRLRVD